MFNLLSKCNTVAEIEKTKATYYPQMLQSDINYLENVDDEEQYPAARCAVTSFVYMYQKSSSQMVEAMNNANKRMRVRASVDVVNSTILLLKMEAERFERQKQFASSCESALTNKGSQLRSEVWNKAKESKEELRVGVTIMENEDPPHYECVVRSINQMWIVEVACVDDDGLFENTCTCGVVEKDMVPCMHVMAVVKSKLIPDLTPTNVMPHCWSAATWRRQFPKEASIACNIDLDYLKLKYTANDKLRYMPDFIGKRKRGRPKGNTRYKSAIEKAMETKKPKKMRKRPIDDDGLGPDDVEFGFGVQTSNGNVDGAEGAV